MNKYITTALSPNTEADDIRLAKKLWLKKKEYINGPSIDKLTSAIANYFGTQNVLLYNSGRSALYNLLESLELNSDDEVLVQAFTCNAVPNPILWAGATPRYVDINSETYCMSPESLRAAITPKSKVLIIQHSFGFPAPLDELLTVARKHNLFVIEDCALALGAYYKDTLVGTLGDASIFSFGRDKIISSVYGGATLVKDATLYTTLQKSHQTLPMPSIKWVKQQIQHPIIFSLAKPLYNIFHIGKAILETSKRLNMISVAVTQGERAGKKPQAFPAQLPNALASLALNQFNKLDRYNTHRKTIANLYREGLQANGIIHPKKEVPGIEQPVYLRYTIQVKNPQELYNYCKNKGIQLGTWYSATIDPVGTEFDTMCYTKSSCPSSEYVAKHVINLPTHINISTTDAKYIIEVINTYFTQ